jgi:hypothetical protein
LNGGEVSFSGSVESDRIEQNRTVFVIHGAALGDGEAIVGVNVPNVPFFPIFDEFFLGLFGRS